jgi:hypothetical protein
MIKAERFLPSATRSAVSLLRKVAASRNRAAVLITHRRSGNESDQRESSCNVAPSKISVKG